MATSVPSNVFARQINPEGNGTKIINKGGKLWILGLKTEGTGTNIETDQGGSREVLGGLIYPVWKISADTPAFAVNDSPASFIIYMVSSYKRPAAGTNFEIQVQETQHGVTKSLLSTSLRRVALEQLCRLTRRERLHKIPRSQSPSPDSIRSIFCSNQKELKKSIDTRKN